MILKINEVKESGIWFSITINEWTSLRNRRYFNIIVHGGKNHVFNLGLVFIPKKSDAVYIKRKDEDRLNEFDITLTRDIIAITTDEESTMIKFEYVNLMENLLCLNHGIYLVIKNVLYEKHEARIDIDSKEYDEEYNIDEDYSCNDENIKESSENHSLKPKYGDVLKAIRKIIKLFRINDTNNNILQNYIKLEFDTELTLLLDLDKRWDSLVLMIERFLKLQHCVKKSLIDIKSENLWKEENIELLNELLEVLKPIKICVDNE